MAIIEDVPAVEVQRRLAPAYGESWAHVADMLLDSPHDAATIATLVSEHRRDGGFEKPVLWVHDDEDNRDSVLDGMHRTIAAATIGGTVALHEGWIVETPPVDMLRVEFEVDMPGPGDDPGDVTDDVFSLLRSFRLPGGPWVTCDLMGGAGDRFEAIWYCPESLSDALAAGLVARAAAHGGRLTVFGVERDDLDDDIDDIDDDEMDGP